MKINTLIYLLTILKTLLILSPVNSDLIPELAKKCPTLTELTQKYEKLMKERRKTLTKEMNTDFAIGHHPPAYYKRLHSRTKSNQDISVYKSQNFQPPVDFSEKIQSTNKIKKDSNEMRKSNRDIELTKINAEVERKDMKEKKISISNSMILPVNTPKMSIMKQILKAGNELIVMENFLKNVTRSPNQIGIGAYGGVYKYKNHRVVGNFRDMTMAVKVFKVGKSIKSPSIMLEQKKLLHEIIMNETLFNESDGRYYFPRILGCNTLSPDIVEYIEEIKRVEYTKNEALKYIRAGFKNKEYIAIKMEQLDYSYSNYLGMMRTQSKMGIMIIDRIRMSINLFKGLSMIMDKSIHCDIKPDNLMIKVLDPNVARSNIPFIKTTLGDHILIKYIDFGMTVEKNHRCQGGTYGYMAPEMFMPYLDHSKFDIFSLGVILVESEMTLLSSSTLSQVLKSIMFYQFKKKVMIDAKMKKELSELEFVKIIMSKMDDLKYSKIKAYILVLKATMVLSGQDFDALVGTKEDFMSMAPESIDILGYSLQFFTATFLNCVKQYIVIDYYRMFQRKVTMDVVMQGMIIKIKKTEVDTLTEKVKGMEQMQATMVNKDSMNNSSLTGELLKSRIESVKIHSRISVLETEIKYSENKHRKRTANSRYQYQYMMLICNMISFHPKMRNDLSIILFMLEDMMTRFTRETEQITQENHILKQRLSPEFIDSFKTKNVYETEKKSQNLQDNNLVKSDYQIVLKRSTTKRKAYIRI